MKPSRHLLFAFIFLICLAAVCRAEEPEKVTVCQLKSDPPRYNHKLIEVIGFVSYGFEDFTLFDPTCPSWPEVWLEYGGKSKSGTMYCCGVTADRQRPAELTIEDILIPLIENESFAEFDKLIHRQVRQSALVHGTLIGRFFAGRLEAFGKGTPSWRGYGHMACCSLLAIQQIKSVDSQERSDLDYDHYPDQPDLGKAGCGFQGLASIDTHAEALQTQHEAESDEGSWVFDDPHRVASDGLVKLAKLNASVPIELKETRKAQGRIIYEWRPKTKSETYMVVVSRPYWLSYYARDPNRIAWVVLGATVSSCGKHNSVTRIR